MEKITVSLTIITKEEFIHFISYLLPRYRVAGPVASDSGFAFEVIKNAAELRLDYGTTILPPKKYLLPPREALFQFNLADHGWVQMVEEAEPTVLVGVHTCDLHAIQLLNRVFNSVHPDPYYGNRSQNTLIVSIECLSPCDEHSFCKSMGTLTADEGYDLHLTDLGQAYAVDIGTTAGEDLLKQYAKIRTAVPDEISRLNAVLSDKWPRFPYRLDFDVSDLPSLLSMSMKSPLWAELGERCLACAACTNVCPTCYCFDVHDEVGLDLQSGERVRTWDSCQLDEFAVVAGGHNFRQKRAMRQRHRFMRKGKYILEAHGYLGCVGCGRCARACLVDITPVSVFNELYRQREGVQKT
jgi:formate hydrogenlyase subunit 6/NADH:ubiquinone oxidoreductase subunit I